MGSDQGTTCISLFFSLLHGLKILFQLGQCLEMNWSEPECPLANYIFFLVPHQLDIIFLCYVANFAKDKKAQGKGKKSNERNFQGPMKTQVSAQGCFRTFSRLL